MTEYPGDEGFEVFAAALEQAARRDAKKRKRAKAARTAAVLTDAYRTEADERILHAVLESEVYKEAQTLFCYVAVNQEPATAPIIEAALKDGKQVAVPRCLGKGVMEAVLIRGAEDLSEKGAFGIPEPAQGLPVLPPEELDLLIVPCVACTRDGARLGHGMGYYDRFMEQASGTSAVLCYEALLEERLPEEPHDRRPDLVISETAVYRIAG